MEAHKVETVLSENGTLILKGLPFYEGDAVEVVILERSRSVSAGETAMKGLEESPSQSEKTLENRPNPFGMGRALRSLC